ncbi:MAG: neprosin family prolyl endopeptidase [Thioploca sp.]|nr:neprosin family prolyl endopeptidase [Thioploca sp.]
MINPAYSCYGGEIIDREIGGRHTATDMGSGNFPESGYGLAAYQRSIQKMDTAGTIIDVNPGIIIVTDAQCYNRVVSRNLKCYFAKRRI